MQCVPRRRRETCQPKRTNNDALGRWSDERTRPRVLAGGELELLGGMLTARRSSVPTRLVRRCPLSFADVRTWAVDGDVAVDSRAIVGVTAHVRVGGCPPRLGQPPIARALDDAVVHTTHSPGSTIPDLVLISAEAERALGSLARRPRTRALHHGRRLPSSACWLRDVSHVGRAKLHVVERTCPTWGAHLARATHAPNSTAEIRGRRARASATASASSPRSW